jgi:hypothetical protein
MTPAIAPATAVERDWAETLMSSAMERCLLLLELSILGEKCQIDTGITPFSQWLSPTHDGILAISIRYTSFFAYRFASFCAIS